MTIFSYDRPGTLHAHCDLGDSGITHSTEPFVRIEVTEGGQHAQYARTLLITYQKTRRRQEGEVRVTEPHDWYAVEVGGKIVYDTRTAGLETREQRRARRQVEEARFNTT